MYKPKNIMFRVDVAEVMHGGIRDPVQAAGAGLLSPQIISPTRFTAAITFCRVCNKVR